MSSAVIKNAEPVIIRGYGNEPVRLRATSVRDGVVEAVGADEDSPMGFPSEDVFQFDVGLFKKLRTAYAAGESQAVIDLWKRATPYT